MPATDPVAFAAFHHGGDRFSAESNRKDILDILDRQPVATQGFPVRHNVEEVAAGGAFGIGSGGSGKPCRRFTQACPIVASDHVRDR
jgi:hypothetical protein